MKKYIKLNNNDNHLSWGNFTRIIKENASLGDMENLSFSTTIAVSGHAEGIVTETGMNTKVGKIAQMIITDEAPETPFSKSPAYLLFGIFLDNLPTLLNTLASPACPIT